MIDADPRPAQPSVKLANDIGCTPLLVTHPVRLDTAIGG